MKAALASFLLIGSLMTVYPQNKIPDATMLFPENNQLMRQEVASMTLRARVFDPDGSINKVEFYKGATLLGNGERLGATDEFTFNHGPVLKGNYSFSAIGYDNTGAFKQSWPAHISVAPNAPYYALVELGTPGEFFEEARGLNNEGVIVGTFNQADGRYAFRFENWKVDSIGGPDQSVDVQNYAVDALGRALGTILLDSRDIGYIQEKTGELHYLTTDFAALPLAVSSRGVVGVAKGDRYEPFFWNGTMLQIIPPGGGHRGEATAINNNGVIAGWSYEYGTSNPRAFLYQNDSFDLLRGSSGETDLVLTAAYGINDNGDIVGSAEDDAFLYRNGTVIRLGTLGAAHVARDINEAGVIVGNYSHEFKPSAFIYHDGVMINLDQLIPKAGYHVETAMAINDRGQIAANALLPGTMWPPRACMLSPIPVQRIRRSSNEVIMTTYPLPGPVIHEESTDLITWTPGFTSTKEAIRYDTSEEISSLQPYLFRRIRQNH